MLRAAGSRLARLVDTVVSDATKSGSWLTKPGFGKSLITASQSGD